MNKEKQPRQTGDDFFQRAIETDNPKVLERYQRLVDATIKALENESGGRPVLELNELPPLERIWPLGKQLDQAAEEQEKRKGELTQRAIIAGIVWMLKGIAEGRIQLSPEAVSELRRNAEVAGITAEVWNKAVESLFGPEGGRDYLWEEEKEEEKYDPERWGRGVAEVTRGVLAGKDLSFEEIQSRLGPMRDGRLPNPMNAVYAMRNYVNRVLQGRIEDEGLLEILKDWQEKNPGRDVYDFFIEVTTRPPDSADKETDIEAPSTEEEADNEPASLALVAAFVKNNASHICQRVPAWFNDLLEEFENLAGPPHQRRDGDDIDRLRKTMIIRLASGDGDYLDSLIRNLDLPEIKLLAGFCRLNGGCLIKLCDQRVGIEFVERGGEIELSGIIVPLGKDEQREAKRLNACWFKAADELLDKSGDPLEVIRQAIKNIVDVYREVPSTVSANHITSFINLGSNAARATGIDRKAEAVPFERVVLALILQQSGKKIPPESFKAIESQLLPLIEFELKAHRKGGTDQESD